MLEVMSTPVSSDADLVDDIIELVEHHAVCEPRCGSIPIVNISPPDWASRNATGGQS